ncbi:unnamed protein product [Periconia digitata]|uniref:Uncharacterized protein n=1 Tax=Periconia digitata TaxID=1303443 RepID=A0A9W4U5Y7_9PLEO|nr:unnamed protein product [Periconia digitata]
MISSLQPNRPKVSPQHPHTQHPTPQYQQQTRATSTSSHTSQQPHPQQSHHQPHPYNQVSAMPPNPAPMNSHNIQLYNAATRHPVFFTPTLFKPPFPLPHVAAGQTMWGRSSPVASGYVLERGVLGINSSGAGGGRTKL